jgi:two-component sensor histidine kinase/PAS domain-containing protein
MAHTFASLLEAFELLDALAGEALLCVDEAGQVLRSNAALRELCEVDHLDVASTELRRLLAWPPQDDALHQANGQIHDRLGRARQIAARRVRVGDGHLIRLEDRSPRPLENGAARASLARIIEAAPLAISLHDARTRRIEELNQAAAALAGRPRQDLIGAPPQALFGSETGERIAADMELAMRADIGGVIQREVRSGAGEQERVWDLRLLHLSGADDSALSGDAGQVLLVATDVTAQRAAEAETLRDAIAQRELLVREVHHRIKNNLQGVAGLLRGTAQRHPEVAGVLADAVGQVNTIAQVYGLQVSGAGPLRIDQLVEAIRDSVQRMSGHGIRAGSTDADIQPWYLAPVDSIPVALALNELLTNAIKHGSGSAVSCQLAALENGVSIEIRNRGELPEGFEPGRLRDISGLSLVRALLPRRGARLLFEQQGPQVMCRLELEPPSLRPGPRTSSFEPQQGEPRS